MAALFSRDLRINQIGWSIKFVRWEKLRDLQRSAAVQEKHDIEVVGQGGSP
jgi:hypothetical protein